MANEKERNPEQIPGEGLPEEERLQDRRPELNYPRQAESTKHIPRVQPENDPPAHPAQDDFQSQPRGGHQETNNP